MIDPTTHVADLTECRLDDLWPLDDLPPRADRTLDMIEESLLATSGPAAGADSQRAHRRLLMMLALDLRAADVLTIADRFDCSPKHVRQEAHRARTLLVDDPAFAALSLSVQRTLMGSR